MRFRQVRAEVFQNVEESRVGLFPAGVLGVGTQEGPLHRVEPEERGVCQAAAAQGHGLFQWACHPRDDRGGQQHLCHAGRGPGAVEEGEPVGAGT